MKAAVIGAGIAGLACARELRAGGIEVQVFEKGRSSGGRLATRRADPGAFDHGAQYFTVREPRFAAAVAELESAGVVARWEGRIVAIGGGAEHPTGLHRRYVGVPGMSAIGRTLADGLDVLHECRVAMAQPAGDGWRLVDAQGAPLGEFDLAVVAAPAPQAAPLLDAAHALAVIAGECELSPCWALLLRFDAPLPLDFDGAFVADAPIAWIMRNNSKPGRPAAECWVAHASPDWSREHLEQEPAAVVGPLVDAFRQVTGLLAEPAAAAAHRWRYALPEAPLALPYLLDEGLRIGACGDWCGGPRVEGAYLSGRALGERIRALV